jgi:hypothetical protein
MPNLRTKVMKRKSDSFVLENAKACKVATEGKKNHKVTVPLSTQFKSLQDAHEAHISENKENGKTIDNLQVAFLEKVKPLIEVKSKESQTSFSIEENLTCNQCTFIGKDKKDLKIHSTSEHSPGQALNEVYYTCYLCGESVSAKWEMMAHRKEKHLSRVRPCKFYMLGACELDAKTCWFRHENCDQNPILPQTLRNFKCGLCEKVFDNKKVFMDHRKNEHTDKIAECRENKNGSCRFKSKDCWFKHNESESNNEMGKTLENSGIVTNDMVGRLFNMMEAFAERMATIENQM